MKLTCLAIDDEPKALEIVEDYIKKVPFLSLAESFRDSLKALDYLQNRKVDLIFLDINMPDLTGIQFLKSLKNPPMIIFTTAYSEYAVASYDYYAVDYLLKPIEFDRFLMAANRAMDQYKLKQGPSGTKPEAKEKIESIMVKIGSDYVTLKTDDIRYIESAGNYVTFYTPNEKYMSLMSMNNVLDMLPEEMFYRIHKSYIIAFKYISKIERHRVFLGKDEIPVGNVYREGFMKVVNSR